MPSGEISPVNGVKHGSKWRLARAGVGVLIAVIVVAGAAMFLTPRPQSVVEATLDNCSDPAPKAGPARPWEAQIQVSTYCAVNTRTRNLFCAIPIVGWGGNGPDMNMALYYNSGSVPANPHVGFSLGTGWSLSYTDHLIMSPSGGPYTSITHVSDEGTQNTYTLSGDDWIAPGRGL